MPFKINVSICVPHSRGGEVWVRVSDAFSSEYVLDVESIAARAQPPSQREAAAEHVRRALGTEEEVLRVRNKTPRKRTKVLLSLKYLFPAAAEVVSEVGSHELRGEKVLLKVHKTKKLHATAGALRLKVSIERVQGAANRRAAEDDEDAENKPTVLPYRAVHSSDSEVDAHNPDTYTCTFYNHNGILAASTIEEVNAKLESRDINNFQRKLRRKQNVSLGTDALIECNVCMDRIHSYGVIRCGHIYCFLCIQSWAGQANRCPLCKARFNVIKKIADGGEEFVPVGDADIDAEGGEIDPVLFANDHCYVCAEKGDEELLLVCESCFTECCHTYCLRPKLEAVPDEKWYCDYCVKNRRIPHFLPLAGIFGEQTLRVDKAEPARDDRAEEADEADDERAEDAVDEFMATVEADLRGADGEAGARSDAMSTEDRAARDGSQEADDSRLLAKRDVSAFEHQQSQTVL